MANVHAHVYRDKLAESRIQAYTASKALRSIAGLFSDPAPRAAARLPSLHRLKHAVKLPENYWTTIGDRIVSSN